VLDQGEESEEAHGRRPQIMRHGLDRLDRERPEERLASRIMGRVPARLLVPSIAWQFRFVEPELRRLDDLVPRDRNAVDVGAWWGPWTWWLARRVPHVDTFEPNTELVARIHEALPGNVTLHPVALSDRDGRSVLWIPGGGVGTEGRASLHHESARSTGWRAQPVDTRRLDDFDLSDVGFVKIDVEGHEAAVLQGATRLLESDRPTVMVEVEQRPDRPDSVASTVDFFSRLGFKGEFLDHGRWQPIERFDRQRALQMARRVERSGYLTNLALFARRCVRNFVFRPV
jgi:FkbM family methyltransferase